MSAFETKSSSEQTSRKKNIVLYNDEGLHPSYSTYQLKQQLTKGKVQQNQTCAISNCYTKPSLSGTLEYIIIVNNPVDVSDIILNIPLLNIDSSLLYNVQVLEYYPSYTVKIRYTLLKQTSLFDGFTFYNNELPSISPYLWHNLNCTNVFIVSFGGMPLSRAGYQFYTLTGISISPNTSPTILPNTSGLNMFFQCTQFNPVRLNWNMSSIISMERMFYGCMAFNPETIEWDTSSVTNMDDAFVNCEILNPPSLNLNVSNVLTMRRTFSECSAMNVDIRSWNVNNVTDMSEMFYNCSSWVMNLSDWPVYVGTIRTGFNTGSSIIPPSVWG
jgi:surface protein